ncbi:MAG: prohibitin family protein [Chloroflexaceae bacterium]|nr:prohibitin family protein [Chloroflexaceae bacterium]
MTTFPELDTGIRIVGIGSAILLVIYVLILFLRTTWRDGLSAGFLSLFRFRVTIPLVIVIGLNLLAFSLVFVRPNEVGVVVSFPSPGGVRPQPLPGGFYFILPFVERVQKYPIQWQTYTMSNDYSEGDKMGDDSIRARTSDGQEIRLACSLILRLDSNQAVLVHIEWQDRYMNDFIRPLARGLVRRQVSQFTVNEVNSSARSDLETNLDRLLRDELAEKGFILDQFLLRDIAFSPEYSLSIEEKQVAFEEQIRAEYQAERIRRLARGRADAVLIEAEARAEALILLGDALKTNKDLLTYRYIEELTSKIKVMLLPNNAPFILPLADLLKDTEGITPTINLTDTQMLDQVELP